MSEFKTPRAKGNGIEIQLTEWPGHGPPLLCLPGLTANSRCFTVPASKLSPQNRVIAMDMRGRGLSDKPETGYSIAHHCQDIAAVMEDIGLDKAAIMGHSLGAYIALAFAAEFPDKTDRIVLMDGGGNLSAEQWAKVSESIKPSLDRLDQVFPSYNEYTQLLKLAPFLQPWSDVLDDYFQYEIEEAEGGVRSRIRRQNIEEERGALLSTDVSGFYPKVNCPVLILRATEGMLTRDDLVLPLETAEDLLKELPQAKLVNLEGLNHYSIVFQENDARDLAIAEFLKA